MRGYEQREKGGKEGGRDKEREGERSTCIYL